MWFLFHCLCHHYELVKLYFIWVCLNVTCIVVTTSIHLQSFGGWYALLRSCSPKFLLSLLNSDAMHCWDFVLTPTNMDRLNIGVQTLLLFWVIQGFCKCIWSFEKKSRDEPQGEVALSRLRLMGRKSPFFSLGIWPRGKNSEVRVHCVEDCSVCISHVFCNNKP